MGLPIVQSRRFADLVRFRDSAPVSCRVIVRQHRAQYVHRVQRARWHNLGHILPTLEQRPLGEFDSGRTPTRAAHWSWDDPLAESVHVQPPQCLASNLEAAPCEHGGRREPVGGQGLAAERRGADHNHAEPSRFPRKESLRRGSRIHSALASGLSGDCRLCYDALERRQWLVSRPQILGKVCGT